MLMITRPWVSLSTIILCLSCASVRPVKSGCPRERGPSWNRFTSEHFVLYTDASAKRARDALADFERQRAGLLAVAWPRSTPPAGKLNVVGVSSVVQFQELSGTKLVVGFAHPGWDTPFL